MKMSKLALALVMSGSALIMAGASAEAQSQTAPQGQLVPIDVWALRDVVKMVRLSPDGKHVLVLKTETKDGEYILEIYKTDDLSKPLRRLNANPMEITSAMWATDNYIIGGAWQVVRKRVNGPGDDVRSYRTFSYNLAKNKFSQIDGEYEIVSTLPKEPDVVLVAEGRGVSDGQGVDPYQAYRPRAYYKFNMEKGTKSLVLKGSDKYPTAVFDDDGNPRFSTGYEAASFEEIQYYRKPGDSSWTEFARHDLNDPKNLYRMLGGFMGAAGFDTKDPNIGYLIDNRGEDKAALWEFNFSTGKFGAKVYGNADADVLGVVKSSMPGDDRIVGAVYPGAKYEVEWFDAQEKALHEALMKQVPNAFQLSVSGRSVDGKTMLITNSGPHDPGSFWLAKDGKLIKMGSKNPLLKPSDLSDVEFIKYPARDGRIIPAYLTKPKGKGPFPLVVLPHGGPHVNEVVTYDEWSQLLANNGYMVLQPQYRMSVGWGQSHFDSAYGQHGLAMQDDKDDGALYLVKQGLVDKDRMAMFGWSYGGYAALVALSRSPNIYQCAIAGAAVADPEKSFIRGSSGGSSPKPLVEWAKRRGMIGINPIHEVSKVNIPFLMVHGDVDNRVEYYHYEDYKKVIEKAGIQGGQFLTLKGADHFYATLMYNHQQEFFTKMIDFLKKDCGPGGL